MANMICDAFCDFGACGGTTSSAENETLNDVDKFYWQRTLFGKRIIATLNNKQTFLPLQKMYQNQFAYWHGFVALY